MTSNTSADDEARAHELYKNWLHAYPKPVRELLPAAKADLVDAIASTLAQSRHERDLLAEAIANAAKKAGIYNGEVPLTGPQLILLCDDLAQSRQRAIEVVRAKRDAYKVSMNKATNPVERDDYEQRIIAANEILIELEGELSALPSLSFRGNRPIK